jgi:hypothetical protein
VAGWGAVAAPPSLRSRTAADQAGNRFEVEVGAEADRQQFFVGPVELDVPVAAADAVRRRITEDVVEGEPALAEEVGQRVHAHRYASVAAAVVAAGSAHGTRCRPEGHQAIPGVLGYDLDAFAVFFDGAEDPAASVRGEEDVPHVDGAAAELHMRWRHHLDESPCRGRRQRKW